MQGKLVDFDETPNVPRLTNVSRDVFDAAFEVAEVFGSARKEQRLRTNKREEQREEQRGEQRGLEVPPKRLRRPSPTCSICGKLGHVADDCYSNAVNQRTEVRCYNCNNYGHYAVRCPRSPTIKYGMHRQGGGAARRSSESGRKEKPQNKQSESEKKGLEVICKLMKDKHLREETAKTTPQLYDEMLTYMIAHVNLNNNNNTNSSE